MGGNLYVASGNVLDLLENSCRCPGSAMAAAAEAIGEPTIVLLLDNGQPHGEVKRELPLRQAAC